MSYVLATLAALVSEWCIAYWCCTPTCWPYILIHPLGMCLAFCLSMLAMNSLDQGDTSTDVVKVSGVLTVLMVALVVLNTFFTSPMFRSTSYRDLGKVQEATEPLTIADTDHIRLIPLESAKAIAGIAVGKGNYGAQYVLGDEFVIQRFKKTLYWVAPLRFKSWGSWWQNGGISPGYVLVNAEDLTAEVSLVLCKLKYNLSGWWSSNLLRYLYLHGYSGMALQEPTFEIDEEGKPFYVVSVTKPSIGFAGHILKEALIVNAETGEIKSYEVGKTPEWADRVFPEDLAYEYSNNWGYYVHGWINSWWLHKDAQMVTMSVVQDAVNQKGEKVTHQEPGIYLIYNRVDHHPIWVAGLTSPSSDTSLTGYMVTDAITGKMTHYKAEAILGNEVAAIKSANAAPEVSRQKGYYAAQPLLYRIYGNFTWVVPILSENHTVQKVALVYAPDTRMVAVGDSKAEALELYQVLLVKIKAPGVVPTQDKKTETAEGRVLRCNLVGQGGSTQLILMIDSHPDRMFTVPSVDSLDIYLTKVGDSVKLTYNDTGEGMLSVRSFENQAFKLRRSKPQARYDETKAKAKQEDRAKLVAEQDRLKHQLEQVEEKAKD